jgi:DNA-binding XRE family transcriptional regulator
MKTPISQVEIAGIQYAIVPVDILKEAAPQLLKPTARIPQNGNIPAEVVFTSIDKDISMMQAWREYLNLTQTEVAARMGVSQASYAQTEKATQPRKATLNKVAKALGVTVEQLKD